jgi:hypothetical protein
MFNKILPVTILVLAAQTSSAMIAKWYVQLRVFDAVVVAFSEEVNLEPTEDMDDVEISSMEVLENGNIVVTSDNKQCTYKMKTNPLPPGAVGTPGYSAQKQDCSDLEIPQRSASYEVVSERLDKAAKLQKMVKSVYVTKKGSIRLTYKN